MVKPASVANNAILDQAKKVDVRVQKQLAPLSELPPRLNFFGTAFSAIRDKPSEEGEPSSDMLAGRNRSTNHTAQHIDEMMWYLCKGEMDNFSKRMNELGADAIPALLILQQVTAKPKKGESQVFNARHSAALQGLSNLMEVYDVSQREHLGDIVLLSGQTNLASENTVEKRFELLCEVMALQGIAGRGTARTIELSVERYCNECEGRVNDQNPRYTEILEGIEAMREHIRARRAGRNEAAALNYDSQTMLRHSSAPVRPQELLRAVDEKKPYNRLGQLLRGSRKNTQNEAPVEGEQASDDNAAQRYNTSEGSTQVQRLGRPDDDSERGR